MGTEIRFGKIGAISVAIAGIAIILFLIGKNKMEQPAYVPAQEQVTEQAQNQATYKNDLYGFGAVFLARAETATECPLTSRLAHDPIKAYIFAEQPVVCARDTQASESFYSEQGGRLETLVFDLKKCRDAVKDKTEKDFCAKYDKVSITDGKATGKEWPSGTWTKSGDYLTFYADPTSGENKNWKSDYKFLVLER